MALSQAATEPKYSRSVSHKFKNLSFVAVTCFNNKPGTVINNAGLSLLY